MSSSPVSSSPILGLNMPSYSADVVKKREKKGRILAEEALNNCEIEKTKRFLKEYGRNEEEDSETSQKLFFSNRSMSDSDLTFKQPAAQIGVNKSHSPPLGTSSYQGNVINPLHHNETLQVLESAGKVQRTRSSSLKNENTIDAKEKAEKRIENGNSTNTKTQVLVAKFLQRKQFKCKAKKERLFIELIRKNKLKEKKVKYLLDLDSKSFIASGAVGSVIAFNLFHKTKKKTKEAVFKFSKIDANKQASDANLDELKAEYANLIRIYEVAGNPKEISGIQNPAYGLLGLDDKLIKQFFSEYEKEINPAMAIILKRADCSLDKCMDLSLEEKHKIFTFLLDGINFYMKHGIFHNDIKLENILVNVRALSPPSSPLKSPRSRSATTVSVSSSPEKKSSSSPIKAGFSDHSGCIFHADIQKPEDFERIKTLPLTNAYVFNEDQQKLNSLIQNALKEHKNFEKYKTQFKELTDQMMMAALGVTMYFLYTKNKEGPYHRNQCGYLLSDQKEPIKETLIKNKVSLPLAEQIERLLNPDYTKRIEK